MIAPVKKSVNHSKTLTSMREVQGSRAQTTREDVFLFVVTRLWKMNSLLVIAVSIFCDSTEFEHHISLNS